MRLIIVVLSFVFLITIVHGDDIFNILPIPPGVSFGMSASTLKETRQIILFRGEVDSVGLFGAFEKRGAENNDVSVSYIYHFSKSKLGAIVYSRISTNMIFDIKTTRLYSNLLNSKATLVTTKTARAGRIWTVKRWTDSKNNIELCLEASTHGTVFTVFSTDYFSFDDFFPPVSEKETQQRILNHVKPIATKQKHLYRQSVDRLAEDTPQRTKLSKSPTKETPEEIITPIGKPKEQEFAKNESTKGHPKAGKRGGILVSLIGIIAVIAGIGIWVFRRHGKSGSGVNNKL